MHGSNIKQWIKNAKLMGKASNTIYRYSVGQCRAFTNAFVRKEKNLKLMRQQQFCAYGNLSFRIYLYYFEMLLYILFEEGKHEINCLVISLLWEWTRVPCLFLIGFICFMCIRGIYT